MEERATILLVSKNNHNLKLLSQVLEKENYNTTEVSGLQELSGQIETDEDYDAGLIDLSGFNKKIWQECEKLRHKNIPFLIISANKSKRFKETSFKYGAQNVLTKPLVIKELLGIIANIISR